MRILAFLAVAVLSFASASQAAPPGGDGTLLAPQYRLLRFGATRPAGWMLRQMQADKTFERISRSASQG